MTTFLDLLSYLTSYKNINFWMCGGIFIKPNTKENILKNSQNTSYVSIPWTDHKPISTTMLLNQNKSNGPNYWKLNTSILNDIQYKELIQKFCASWQKQKIQYENFTDWWDMGKCHIKSLSMQSILN